MFGADKGKLESGDHRLNGKKLSIGLVQASDIDRIVADGVMLKDGSALKADLVVLATGYKGIDPEINQGGAAPGVDYNNFYPKTRTVLFGVNVSF